jgi:hypothetical protein
MGTSDLILAVIPVTTLVVLITGLALPFIAASRSGRSRARGPAAPRGTGATPVGYLYVACVGIGYHGHRAGTRRWVQEVPIVRKTARLIFYASESWDRREAVVSPGCISREQFETDGVIPVPGHRHGPGPAGHLFFASREAAEAALYLGEGERAERGGAGAPSIRELRRAMADAHPDRGGSAEQFIEARRRYETALQADAA